MAGAFTPQFAKIAAKYARLPEVKRLFEELSSRYEILAAMQTQFAEAVKRNREAREDRPVKIGRRGKRMIEEFHRDAERATPEIDRLAQAMDDRRLLLTEVSSLQEMIGFDEGMLSEWHPDDQPRARDIVNHQRQMLKLVEDFIESSSFKRI